MKGIRIRIRESLDLLSLTLIHYLMLQLLCHCLLLFIFFFWFLLASSKLDDRKSLHSPFFHSPEAAGHLICLRSSFFRHISPLAASNQNLPQSPTSSNRYLHTHTRTHTTYHPSAIDSINWLTTKTHLFWLQNHMGRAYRSSPQWISEAVKDAQLVFIPNPTILLASRCRARAMFLSPVERQTVLLRIDLRCAARHCGRRHEVRAARGTANSRLHSIRFSAWCNLCFHLFIFIFSHRNLDSFLWAIFPREPISRSSDLANSHFNGPARLPLASQQDHSVHHSCVQSAGLSTDDYPNCRNQCNVSTILSRTIRSEDR